MRLVRSHLCIFFISWVLWCNYIPAICAQTPRRHDFLPLGIPISQPTIPQSFLQQPIPVSQGYWLSTTPQYQITTSPPTVIMPNVVGLSVAQALQELQRMGIQPMMQGSSNLALRVTGQQPQPGMVLPMGSAITLFTDGISIQGNSQQPGTQSPCHAYPAWYPRRFIPQSCGQSTTADWSSNTQGFDSRLFNIPAPMQAMIPMPNIFRLSQADAFIALQKVGLTVGQIIAMKANVQSGLVINQYPQARALVPVGTAVVLWIAQ